MASKSERQREIKRNGDISYTERKSETQKEIKIC